MAQVRIEMGVDRVEAENGPQAHAITKWLGRDSTDVVPRTGSIALGVPGWLDGLLRRPVELLLRRRRPAGPGRDDPGGRRAPTRCRWPGPWSVWANAQGGRDNISVALARHA